jgi:hypothetical protein
MNRGLESAAGVREGTILVGVSVAVGVGGALAAAAITMWASAPRRPVNVASSMSGDRAVLNLQGSW